MNGLIPAIVLISISILLWIIYFISKSTSGKNVLANFKAISEKYGFELDETNKIGANIYPLAKGVYKNRQIGIGCYVNNDDKKKQASTYVRAECSNTKNLAFDIIQKSKNSTVSISAGIINMMDSEFDVKFIVTGNSPKQILPVFTFNIKYSLIQVANLGFKGRLKLNGNLLDYTEPELIKDENSKTRIELIMHILCDIADEIEKIA